jgi:hypothetical protein
MKRRWSFQTYVQLYEIAKYIPYLIGWFAFWFVFFLVQWSIFLSLTFGMLVTLTILGTFHGQIKKYVLVSGNLSVLEGVPVPLECLDCPNFKNCWECEKIQEI